MQGMTTLDGHREQFSQFILALFEDQLRIELLADDEIEAIYNPLPNHLHVPWTTRAAEAGKHVLCEKPIGLSTEEAARYREELLICVLAPKFNSVGKVWPKRATGAVRVLESPVTRMGNRC